MSYNQNNPNGSATMANSSPVVIASDQIVSVNEYQPVSSTGAITTTQSVTVVIGGNTSVGFDVVGTWTGAMIAEVLIGTTWTFTDCFNNTLELVSSNIITNGSYIAVNIAGATQFRVRGNTVLTGSATVSITATSSQYNYPFFAREQGFAVGSYGVQMGGVDATANTFQFQKVNTLGAAGVYLESSNKAVYAASGLPITPPATPTDIVRISGSASKTVRVLKIILNTTQTATGINDWFIIKRSTANVGGTSAATVSTPFDSAFAAPTAVCLRYTANPTTLGTVVGNVAICNILSSSIAPGTSGTSYVPYVFDFTNNPVVLRGVAEGLSINFNGAALPNGLSVNYQITFSEE